MMVRYRLRDNDLTRSSPAVQPSRSARQVMLSAEQASIMPGQVIASRGLARCRAARAIIESGQQTITTKQPIGGCERLIVATVQP
jgi:hypothetical protein